MKPGDILAFSGDRWLSTLINLFTYGIPGWSHSHVGVVANHGGDLLLYESTILSDLPCAIRQEQVKGVHATLPMERIERYRGRLWHYPVYRPLYNFESERLSRFLDSQLGVAYDHIGAVRAGGLGWSWFESLIYPEDLSAIFCSELCAAAYREIGLMPTNHVSRWSPNKLIRYLRRQGILLSPTRLK